jgi:hypothetical protein
MSATVVEMGRRAAFSRERTMAITATCVEYQKHSAMIAGAAKFAVGLAGGLVFALAPLAVAQEPSALPSAGTIVGFISDGRSSAVHTGKAVVFLLDGKTGLPLASGARGPFDTTNAHPFQFSDYCHAVTDETSAFRFDDVPPGTYRLVAQAWAGVAGMADALPASRSTCPVTAQRS